MLYPEHWRSIGSFWDALTLANVFPRYFHFLAASIALTGLFLAVYFGRQRFFASLELQSLRREQLVRSFYGVAFGSTLAQFVFGPLLFLTLPAHAVSTTLVVILAVAVLPLAAPDDHAGPARERGPSSVLETMRARAASPRKGGFWAARLPEAVFARRALVRGKPEDKQGNLLAPPSTPSPSPT